MIFHGNISLNLVLPLLLLLSFMNGSRSELISVSLIVNTKSKLIYLYGFQLPFVAVMASRSHFFRLYQQIKFYVSKVKLRQGIKCNRVILLISVQQRITSQKHSCGFFFWQIASIILNKGKSTIPPLYSRPEVLSSASDKATLFAGNLKNSILDDSGIFLPAFAFTANLK